MATRRRTRGSLAFACALLALAAASSSALGAAGDLDPGFGTGGKVTTPFGGQSNDFAKDVAIQADGKIVAVGASGPLRDVTEFAVVRYNTNGTLDTSFGGDGIVTTSFGAGLHADARAVAIKPGTGEIVVAGATFMQLGGGQGPGDFALARYEPDGDLDPTFSGDGKLTTNIESGGSSEDAQDVAIQPTGEIVAVGLSGPDTGDSQDMAVVRYTATGALDPSFSGDGKETTDFDAHDDAQAVAVQGDGKIVVAGTVFDQNFDSADFAIARYNANGTLDTSGFGGGDGKVQDDLETGTNDVGSGLAIQGDAKIVVGGSSDAGGSGGANFAVVRYESDGDRDDGGDGPGGAGFGGGDGLTTADFGDNDSVADVALSGTAIVAVGNAGNELEFSDFGVARFEADGDLDATFSAPDGKLTHDIFSTHDLGSAVAIQPSDGKVVVAGGALGSLEAPSDFILTRYTSAGAVDATFDGDGEVDTKVGSAFDNRVQALAVQADGKIVAAGSSFDEPAADDQDFAIARYNSNGTLDTGFAAGGTAGNGVETIDFGGGDKFDLANGVAIQPSDGKIVVAGFSNEGGDNDFAVARLNTNGSLDTTGFGGGDGKVTTDFDTIGRDEARDVAIQADGKIVVAGRTDASGNPEIAVARYNPDGTLDDGGDGPGGAGFSGDGKITTGVGPEAEGSGVAIQPDGKIVVSGGPFGGFAVVRYNPDGSLDTTSDSTPATQFGGDGIAETTFGGVNEGASDVAIQPNGAIVAAGILDFSDAPTPTCFTGALDRDFALARYEPDGDPDNTFSGDGKLSTDFGGGLKDEGYGVAVQADGAIVAAGLSGPDFALARYTAAGAPDTGFGGAGLLTTDFAAGSCDEAAALALSSAGIVVAGNSGGTFALARYQATNPPPPPPPPPQQLNTPPETTITAQPKNKVKTKKKKVRLRWEFISSEAGVTFLCRVDNRAFVACTSPFSKKLRPGRHSFQVQAVDPAGAADPTPGTDTVKVKRKR